MSPISISDKKTVNSYFLSDRVLILYSPILSEFFVKCFVFRYNGDMTKKLSLIGVLLIILFLIFMLTPHIQHRIRLEEMKVIPKVTTTDHVQAVPEDDIQKLISSQKTVTIIFLNAKNTELNKRFDAFVNEHPTLGLNKKVYIFQDLYRDKLINSLQLDDSAINVVTFQDSVKQSVFKISGQTQLDEKLFAQLK